MMKTFCSEELYSFYNKPKQTAHNTFQIHRFEVQAVSSQWLA